MKLTPKQEKFVQNIIKGMSQREAYKNSYNACNMSNNTIDSHASRLFNNDRVMTRYKELVEQTKKKTILQSQEIQEMLTNIATRTEQEKDVVVNKGKAIRIERPAKLDTIIKALQELNKMQGNNLERVELNVPQVETITSIESYLNGKKKD